MDLKNTLAAVSLSAAIIVLWGLFFAPDPQEIKEAQLNKEINEYNNDPLKELLKFTKLSISEIQQKISPSKLMSNRRLAESINCNDIKTSLLYGKSI